MTRNTPANITGAPSTTVNASGGAPVFVSANYNPNNELKITLTLGATNVNSGNNILIFPTLTPYKIISALAAALPDQQAAGVVLSSSVTNTATAANNLTDWKSYSPNCGLTIGYIRITTNDTTIYNGNLNYGIMPFVGQSVAGYFPLPNYAKTSGGSYAKDLLINTFPDGSPLLLPITNMTYMFFDNLPASSTTSLYLGVAGVNGGNLSVAS